MNAAQSRSATKLKLQRWFSDMAMAFGFATVTSMFLGCAVLGLTFLFLPEWAPRVGHLTAMFGWPVLLVTAFRAIRKK